MFQNKFLKCVLISLLCHALLVAFCAAVFFNLTSDILLYRVLSLFVFIFIFLGLKK
jgi:hypothetical protein